MSKYSRFAKQFGSFGVSPIAGIGFTSVLMSGGSLLVASNNPSNKNVSVADTGVPHATTHKHFVPDVMSKNPKVMNSPTEWPRVNNNNNNNNNYNNNNNTNNNSNTNDSEYSDYNDFSEINEKEKENKDIKQLVTDFVSNVINVENNENKNETENKLNNENKETLVLEMNEINEYIDHTQLKPFATKHDIETLCNEAKMYNFKSVCVNPVFVEYCSKLLKGTNVKVCCVVGFPLGANNTRIKVLEALQAVHDGAQEIDMVIGISLLKSKEWDLVEEEIRLVVEAVNMENDEYLDNHYASSNNNKNDNNIIVKVILETSMLTKEEIVKACEACVRAGASFVKTSTGFGGGGATVENVKLMNESIKNELKRLNKNMNDVKIKASGGVRSFNTAKEMIKAGASRLGTSSSIQIVTDNDNKNVSNSVQMSQVY